VNPRPPIVLVSEGLRPLAGATPDWPVAAETLFVPLEESLPPESECGPVVAIIPLVSRPVGATELGRYPGLRVIANYGVGYDNIDVGAAAEHGVPVTNTPDVLTDATADLTMALLLAAARRLREGLDLARSGEWAGWRPDELLGMGLQGRTLGILGAGRIGGAVAARARAFGMQIGYWDRGSAPELEQATGAERAESLEALLQRADVLSIHLPLTSETHELLGARELSSMMSGSILVNTARGPIVRMESLIEALRDGPLAAAGLDVYPDEPLIPAELRELPNAFILPHLGSATYEARLGMWRLAAENVRRVLKGEPPVTPVPGSAPAAGLR
jgi:glyoxylate reductase